MVSVTWFWVSSSGYACVSGIRFSSASEIIGSAYTSGYSATTGWAGIASSWISCWGSSTSAAGVTGAIRFDESPISESTDST